VLVIPEGLIESIPEMYALIQVCFFCLPPKIITLFPFHLIDLFSNITGNQYPSQQQCSCSRDVITTVPLGSCAVSILAILHQKRGLALLIKLFFLMFMEIT
jgi:hypothetical protein